MIPIYPDVLSCDVLIMGGGIGGLMAAISAAENGASVIVAEKANTRRSGSGATGNDHFVVYIPEVHGAFEDFMTELRQTQAGLNADGPILRRFARRSFEVCQDWHKWGINMRVNDTWTFEGHAYPGHMRTHLKYDGHDQKKILTAEAKKRGVTILNHCPITELLTNDTGRITGALALDVSEEAPSLRVFACRALIAATGSTNRIYSSSTPGWMFNVAGCPADAGGGLGAPYRVGATMVNLDIAGLPAGPKYFSRAGKGTWIGVLRDLSGRNIGPFVDKPSREHGDITSDVWPGVFKDKMKDGSGPVYIDCTDIDEEEMQYLYWALTCEGDTSLLDAMAKQGIDLRDKMVEFGSYECTLLGRGVMIDVNGASTVPGLYAVGDQVGNFLSHISGAATYGRIAGEEAVRYIQETTLEEDLASHPTVLERRQFYSEMMDRTEGAGWKELNILINQLMDDYCPVFAPRSETKFEAGAGYFADARRLSETSLKCSNAHELMRACETLDLLDVGEAVLLSARERKETRGVHVRPDYPFTNPLLNNHFVEITRTASGVRLNIRPAQP